MPRQLMPAIAMKGSNKRVILPDTPDVSFIEKHVTTNTYINNSQSTEYELSQQTPPNSKPILACQAFSVPTFYKSIQKLSATSNYHCKLCNSDLQYKFLSIHNKLCRGHGYFECNKCSKVLKDSSSLFDHLYEHKVSNLICPKCCKTFEKPAKFKMHLNTHISDLKRTLLRIKSKPRVPTSFAKTDYSRVTMKDTLQRMIIHNRSTRSKLLQNCFPRRRIHCYQCNFSFSTRSRYLIHYQSAHPIETIKRVDPDSSYSILTSDEIVRFPLRS